MKIAIAAFDGVDELDLVGPLEVLRRAAQLDPRFHVELTARGPSLDFRGQFGLPMGADSILDRVDADILIVPGGGWSAGSTLGVRGELNDGTLPAHIAAVHERGGIIASVCTGALLVAASGIAAGRRMTTHASARSELERLGIQVVRERVVDDGSIVSGGGVTSGIDLALHLVERFAGADLAAQIAETIELAHRATSSRPD